MVTRLLWLFLGAALALSAQPNGEYALVLDAPPLAEHVASRKEFRTAAALDHVAALRDSQNVLTRELSRRGIRTTGAAQTLVNAIFIRATSQQAAQLRSLPGVRRVEYLPPLKRHLNRALDLVRATQAWSVVGGEGSAGAGAKIGIIDTGIDHTHPAFQDASLQAPAGYPRGRPEDLPYTNSKIIVARSYVAQLPFAQIQAEDSRPDDTTPRDRVGHGTAAAMIAAGRRVIGPTATIAGVAPKAWLGNYKIFASPGVNDTTKTPVVIQALEDALSDGMDVVTLSIGSPASYGALDRCQDRQGRDQACDIRAESVENAVRAGLAVVVSAGNDGDFGLRFPALNSIHTPGTAPTAITVGATTNAHVFFASVRVSGADRINAIFGNGPKPGSPLTAPLRDVATLQDNGRACSPLGAGSLAGAIALVQRGDCGFADKVNNSQKAGAVGVIIYREAGADFPFAPLSLAETGIPAVLVGNRDGLALKNLLASNSSRTATLDPALTELSADFDTVADFSSRGPSIGDVSKGHATIKPDLAAVGTDMYTATQSFDPNGDLWNASLFTSAQGTSFAVPMVAGAAALVKQRNPGFTAVQLKSAVVNTASNSVDDDAGLARVTAVGAGKLNIEAALQPGATLEPATLSFGVINPGTLPKSLALRVTNTGSSAATFTLAVAARDADSRAQITLTPSSVQLNPGQTSTVAVALTGTPPSPGSYEGAITVRGGSANLRVPYLYLAGDGVVQNLVPIFGDGFVGIVGEPKWLMGFKAVDRLGVPVRNAAVRFRVPFGGGRIDLADPTTDVYGIAAADVTLGPRLGEQQFSAEAGGLTLDFFGRARVQPVIDASGVLNAASFQPVRVAPGSYITIRGRGLSESTRVATTASLPLSLAAVSVSFDTANSSISLPGRLHFVSENQINVQIPWEFRGLNTALMKVSVGPGFNDSSALFDVQLADQSPASFEYDDAASGRRLVAALDANFALLTAANAARRGQAIQIYANGLGPVDNQPASGEPSPGAEPLARTRVVPTVTLGGRPAQVLFSGLAPNLVGLYQINVVVPADTPTGIQPVVISINGVESKSASIAIQ
ncbi:MAG: S8 family serine peptidase [Bryobacteraceae bacterium]